MHPYRFLLLFSLCAIPAASLPALARVDTAVLTETRQIQAHIYNSADLTLIKDTRILHFAEGPNPVRFSWSGTLIDPTSLSLEISDPALPLEITQVQFPAGETNQAVWHVTAEKSCRAEVVIRYFTSGLSWEPRYTAIVSRDQTRMHLTGRVRITNRSGMDYPDARVSLVTGEIHLLDQITHLAGQPFPHGRPDAGTDDVRSQALKARENAMMESAPALMLSSDTAMPAPRPVRPDRAADFVVYTLDGNTTLSHGWSDQRAFVQARDIPVDTVYVYDDSRFGDKVMRMVSFVNDTESGLGTVPLPGGRISLFQALDNEGLDLTSAGSDTAGYIPAGNRHQIRMGPDPRITVVPRVMGYAKTNLTFDRENTLTGFDEVRTMALVLANFSDQPAGIDIFRTVSDQRFSISGVSGQDVFEKIDQNRFRFSATVSPGARHTIHYTLTIHRGDRK
jgi:hypothetical protein